MGKLSEALRSTNVRDTNFYIVPDEEQALQERYEKECGPVISRPYVEWIHPGVRIVTVEKEPTARLGKSCLSFNEAAVALLGKPDRIQVGVTVDGLLAVCPAEKHEPGYKLSITLHKGKITHATVGRDFLVKRLHEKGLAGGLYALSYDNKLRYFLGKWFAD